MGNRRKRVERVCLLGRHAINGWKPWFRNRMRLCQEPCQGCGLVPPPGWMNSRTAVPILRFGHIRARSIGGSDLPENIAIVCAGCDRVMGTKDWTGIFPSVCDLESWSEFIYRYAIGRARRGLDVDPYHMNFLSLERRQDVLAVTRAKSC